MSLTVKTFVKGDMSTIRIQVKENGSPKDVTGMAFKLGVKERSTDSAYKIGPVTGTIDDAVNGKVSFSVASGNAAFAGVYEIAMYDAESKKAVLTPAGGVGFKVVESIID